MDSQEQLLVTLHSQKGGVGKSVLAWHLSNVLARGGTRDCLLSEETRNVVLIDADVTGTSLADVLDLKALNPNSASARWMDIDRTRRCVGEEYGGCFPDDDPPRHPELGFVNQILISDPVEHQRLLCPDCADDAAQERTRKTYDALPVKLRHYLWRTPNVTTLRIIPSSSHPQDVRLIAPHIFREDITDHFCHRFADLALTLFGRNPSTGKRRRKKHPDVRKNGFDAVIIDCPPGLHGMSYSALKCHNEIRSRIGQKAEPQLRQVAILVFGEDVQDVVAISRTVYDLLSSADARLRPLLVINRYSTLKVDGSERRPSLKSDGPGYGFKSERDVRAFFIGLLKQHLPDTAAGALRPLLEASMLIPDDGGLATTFKKDCPRNLPDWTNSKRLQQLIRRVLES